MNAICTCLSSATLLAATLLAASEARAETRHLALPNYRVTPGAALEVPLTLDNAAGLAALRVQVNFDSKVLALEAVTQGPLGAAFEFSHGEGDGSVRLVFARATELAGGAGRLAALRFRANPGSVADMVSELAIADLGLADATGVIDLRQKDVLATSNGEVIVSPDQDIDNAGNGLPDWWEELHGLDPFQPNARLDPDGDGFTNMQEFAFGGNPGIADAHLRGPRTGRAKRDGETFMSISFFRRQADAGLLVRVEESPDLSVWRDLPVAQHLLAPPADMGDGTEFVEVLGTLPLTGPQAEPQGFLRVVVEQSE